MNADPHTHKLTIDRDGAGYRIDYGDQTIWCWAWFSFFTPGPRRLRRLARRIVRRHDRHTLHAAKHRQTSVDIQRAANAKLMPVREVPNVDYYGRKTGGTCMKPVEIDVWGSAELSRKDLRDLRPRETAATETA